MNKRMLAGAVAVLSAALVGCGTALPSSSAAGAALLQSQSVTSSAGVLHLQLSSSVPGAKVLVGPQAGRVELYGIPGVAEGAVYSGIRELNWSNGPGTVGLQLEVTQNTDFDVKLQTGAGDLNLQTKWIVPAGATGALTPSLEVRTGPGRRQVSVDLESFSPDVNFGLLGRMGAGITELRSGLQFKQGSRNAAATVDWNFSGSADDKAELSVDNEARTLNLNLSPRLMSSLVTKVIGDDPSDRATVNFRPVSPAGGAKIGFEMVSSAPVVDLNYDVRGGAGMDEINLNLGTLNRATVNSQVNIQAGQGSDKLEMKYDGLPSNSNLLEGPILLGGGDDEAKLEFRGVTRWVIALDCGEGTDKAIGFIGAVNCELN